MIDWLSNPEAPYVLAAYGVAATGLLGLLLFSWRAYRRRQKEWRRRKPKRAREKA